jgi:RluA family pseudouridine synthase
MTPVDESCILRDADGWLVADKPAGLETIVTGGGDPRECFTTHLRRALGLPFLRPVHRLDRDTTGCLLLARDEALVEPLEESFRQRQVRKDYLGLCLGAPKPPTGTVTVRLGRWRPGRRPVQTAKGRRGRAAETEYSQLALGGGGQTGGPRLALVRFRPHTGRTHQIRVHAECLGHPLLGDDQYGQRDANRQAREAWGLARQGLHAWRLAFRDPQSGSRMHVTAPIPADLRAVLDAAVAEWQEALHRP